MEQCHDCPYHVYWSCQLCAGFSDDFLQTCILKDKRFLPTKKESSLAAFLLKYQPILFLQYLGKQQNQPPNIGDFVITLTSGFRSTEPGILLQVTGSDNLCISLQAKKSKQICCRKENMVRKIISHSSRISHR